MAFLELRAGEWMRDKKMSEKWATHSGRGELKRGMKKGERDTCFGAANSVIIETTRS